VLRPAEEFPTPLFRLVCGWIAGGIAAGVAVAVEQPAKPWEVALALVALFSAGVPLRLGTSLRRLAAASFAAAALVVALALVAAAS
jgi:hypothetical protein